MFELKRFIIFIAVGLMLLGTKLYPSELQKSAYDMNGDYTALSGRFERAEFSGDMDFAIKLIEKMCAEVVFTEQAADTEILYCYTRKIGVSKTVAHKKINLVVAVANGYVRAGSPLLKGSY